MVYENGAHVISAIAAMSANRVIGNLGDIPWRTLLPEEQKLFRKYTLGKTVIMGRRTWESLPERYRPLPGRLNIVVTSAKTIAGGCFIARTVEEALSLSISEGGNNEHVLIGGQRVYEEGLPYCSKLYLTELNAMFVGDTFFPEINESDWSETYLEDNDSGNVSYRFRILERTVSPTS